ncbi:deoxyuridine 5'-triphosphate nucleotidohydrolase [Staphylococcus aureus]|nr:deoxyuridine 5'-triphosphate nucleotidohydrolase [Staphylococcus aureus]CYE07512.1 deoxyuridine 5'-triphosphate nucleotidohydrolase [Staphylococcus aureus]
MNNREQIEQSVISASAYNGNDTEGLLKEIEDVYKKAQAFDEILEGLPNAMQDALKEDIYLDEAVGIMVSQVVYKYEEEQEMTNTLQVKLLSENARMPERNHKTDAGYDIFSAETVVLEPQEKAVIKTDVAVSIPEGYVGLLTSRSGVSSKTHLVIETGKIDAGYHGNLGINIKNDAQVYLTTNEQCFDIQGEMENSFVNNAKKKPFTINDYYEIYKGDKLAQLVIVPIWTPELKQVEEFESVSERGAKGFGSSGV